MQLAVWRNAGHVTIIAMLALILSACGDKDFPDQVPAADAAELDIDLSGSVGDGPVVSATVMLQDSEGNVLLSDVSDEQANYKLKGRVKRKDYPLILAVSDGTDLVTGARPDFGLSAVVHQQGGARTANLNPQGTLIRAIAQQLPGGLSRENIDQARQIVLAELAFGLDTAKVPDPVATPIDTSNVTTIVRASEALGEVLRRVRDRLISAGETVTADQVLERLAADLVDGKVDGRGAAQADPRVAALTALISGEVIYEVTQNRLNVDGYRATDRLDNSIRQIMSNRSPSEMTADLRVTGQVIANARKTFTALASFYATPEAIALRDSVDRLESGDSASGAISAFPEGAADVFDAAITSVTLASNTELESVNAVMRQSGTVLPPEPEPMPEPDADPAANRAPEIGGSPAQQVVIDSWYDFQPQAADADGDELTFSIVNRPAWLSFDTVSGRLSGFPDSGDAGRFEDITISVSDSDLVTSLPSFSIIVLEAPNSAPVISGSPQTSLVAGQSYNFQPSASDPDGDPLLFAISNMPAWANFNTANGRLYGTPTAADIGNSGTVVISVSDDKVSAALPAFSISVTAVPNSTPSISGTPGGQVLAGQLYSFQPVAADADGDTLTFSIENRPTWASFNTATGRLYGTPDAGDAGAWSGIRIRVSDGITTAELSAFAIQVQSPTATSSDVELTWVAPVTNVDGSALTDLAGFKLYYGRQGGSFTDSVEINNANATSYLVQDLDAGNWQFVLTAVNTSGQESRFSGEANFSIN